MAEVPAVLLLMHIAQAAAAPVISALAVLPLPIVYWLPAAVAAVEQCIATQRMAVMAAGLLALMGNCVTVRRIVLVTMPRVVHNLPAV